MNQCNTTCPVGTFANNATKTCTTCQPGCSSCSNATRCDTCNPFTLFNETDSSCYCDFKNQVIPDVNNGQVTIETYNLEFSPKLYNNKSLPCSNFLTFTLAKNVILS